MTDQTQQAEQEAYDAWKVDQPWYIVSADDKDDPEHGTTHRLMNIAAWTAWEAAAKRAALAPAAPAVGAPDAITQRILDTMKGSPAASAEGVTGWVDDLALRLFKGSATDHNISIRHSPRPGDVPIYTAAPAASLREQEASIATIAQWQEDAARFRTALQNIVQRYGHNDSGQALAKSMHDMAQKALDAQRLGREKGGAP